MYLAAEYTPRIVLRMNNWIDLVKSRMKELEITQESLAERLGVTQGAIAHWLSGRREPGLTTISEILRVLRMPPLLIGIASEPLDIDEKQSGLGDDYTVVNQYSAKGSAGNGYQNDHIEVIGRLAFKRDYLNRLGLKADKCAVIYAHGHSMEPTICDGEVLLIDNNATTARSGSIYAILRPDGEVSIKRLVQGFAGAWTIRSDNPDKVHYPDEPINADDLQQLAVIGRVAWRGGSL